MHSSCSTDQIWRKRVDCSTESMKGLRRLASMPFSASLLSKGRCAAAVGARSLATATRSRIRKSFVMSVNSGLEAEYKRRHDEIWPELSAELKRAGAHNYSIFLHPDTNQLFAYVEIESQEQWDSLASTEVVQRWWAYMADVMPSNPDGSPTSVETLEMFHLE